MGQEQGDGSFHRARGKSAKCQVVDHFAQIRYTFLGRQLAPGSSALFQAAPGGRGVKGDAGGRVDGAAARFPATSSWSRWG